jgi:hypothetical protein
MTKIETLQANAKPSWHPQEVRLVYLTYRSNMLGIMRCQTLAASLNEAVTRARRKYGPGDLNSWGTRNLPIVGGMVGGGEFLRGKRDIDFQDDVSRIYP